MNVARIFTCPKKAGAQAEHRRMRVEALSSGEIAVGVPVVPQVIGTAAESAAQ